MMHNKDSAQTEVGPRKWHNPAKENTSAECTSAWEKYVAVR